MLIKLFIVYFVLTYFIYFGYLSNENKLNFAQPSLFCSFMGYIDLVLSSGLGFIQIPMLIGVALWKYINNRNSYYI